MKTSRKMIIEISMMIPISFPGLCKIISYNFTNNQSRLFNHKI